MVLFFFVGNTTPDLRAELRRPRARHRVWDRRDGKEGIFGLIPTIFDHVHRQFF